MGLGSLVVFVLLFLELLKILCVSAILGSLLVFGESSSVLVLGCIGLILIRFSFNLVQVLPVFPNELGNFREGEVVTLEVFSHF